MHNKEYSLELTLPALGVIYLKRVAEAKTQKASKK